MNVLFFHRYVVMTSAKLRLKLRGQQPRPLRFFELIDLSTVFFQLLTWQVGKIRRHHWKELLKISKIAKFECDLLKTNEDSAPQSREILQMFVWWGGGLATNLPPAIQTFVNFRNFAWLYLVSLKTYYFQIWQFYYF